MYMYMYIYVYIICTKENRLPTESSSYIYIFEIIAAVNILFKSYTSGVTIVVECAMICNSLTSRSGDKNIFFGQSKKRPDSGLRQTTL